MIFLDHSLVIAYAVLLVFAALGAIGFRFAIRKRGVLRASLSVVAILTLVAGWVIFASFKLGYAQVRFSPPIFSADRMHALRIEDDGIDSKIPATVYLYSNHGFIVDRVSQGTWKAVKAADVRWLSNSEVLIIYGNSSRKYYCASTREVKVSVDQRESNETKWLN
jgi:hypothetical protein